MPMSVEFRKVLQYALLTPEDWFQGVPAADIADMATTSGAERNA